MVKGDLRKLLFSIGVAAAGIAGCVWLQQRAASFPFPGRPLSTRTSNSGSTLLPSTANATLLSMIATTSRGSTRYCTFPVTDCPSGSESDSINNYLKHKYSDILTRLAAGQKPSNYEEQQVADMFKGQPLSAYAVAAQNLRVQQGMRERFREGLLRSRNYRPTMERISPKTVCRRNSLPWPKWNRLLHSRTFRCRRGGGVAVHPADRQTVHAHFALP